MPVSTCRRGSRVNAATFIIVAFAVHPVTPPEEKNKGQQWLSSCRSTAVRRSPIPNRSNVWPSALVQNGKEGQQGGRGGLRHGDTTDDLIDQALSIDSNPPEREMDMLMTAGERISMSLLAIAIHAEGSRAHSFTGQQAGFFTDARYGAAHIKAVRPDRVNNASPSGDIAIVAGFQGINAKGDATTLGRGGSDTSAVALAVALGADICEIH